jgi:hypothetical protein
MGKGEMGKRWAIFLINFKGGIMRDNSNFQGEGA